MLRISQIIRLRQYCVGATSVISDSTIIFPNHKNASNFARFILAIVTTFHTERQLWDKPEKLL